MKYPVLFIIICYNTYNIRILAQELPVCEKKIYISPDHKIYISKSNPAYFFISTSPDSNARSVRLKSNTSPQNTHPMYFDTEGRNLIWTPYAVDTFTKKVVLPKKYIQFHFYVDGEPPKTKIRYNKSYEFFNNGIHYMPGSIDVSFESVDVLSGVDKTYYSLDSSDFRPWKNVLLLDKEKKYIIKYFSVDNTGNVEKLKEIKFIVDKTPPVSKLEIIGEKYEYILSGNTQLSITATDNFSGVKNIFVSIDDTIYKLYKGIIKTAAIKEGEHKLYYYSTDKVNNIESVKTFDFYVDKTPPQVIEEVIGKTFIANGKEFSAGTSMLKITSFDNKAGVKEIFYSINNAPYLKYEKPILLSGYKGALIVNSYAVDNVGNKSQNDYSNSRKNSISYIDLSGPWVGHSFSGPVFTNRDTIFINNKTRILLDAKDTESGVDRIEYQTDSSDLKVYSVPFILSNEGVHHISMYGYDHLENMTRQVFDVVVDTTGPVIYERFSSPPVGTLLIEGKKINEYPNTLVIFLSATDDRSGYQELSYQLNNNPVQSYVKDINGFIPGKINIIKAKAIDKLGNKSEKIIEFSIR